MRNFWKIYWLVLLMAAIKLAIQLLAPSHFYDLQRDEYLYLAEGNHLAWGYLEVPPAMAVLAVIVKLLGGSIFVVRLIPALIGALTLFLTGMITKELGGNQFARFLATLAFLASAYLRVNMLFQPNSLEILYFTWCAYWLVRYINRPDQRYFLYIGIIGGLGLMNKYSMGLFFIGAAAGLILTPYRKLLRNKYIYFGLLISLLIFLPNLIWQIIHRFPVLHHMNELSKYQLVYVNPGDFLTDQLGMCLPGCLVWLAGLFFYLFSVRGKPYRWLGWTYLTVIAVLLILHGKDYYALATYPMLMAAGGVYISRLTLKPILRWVIRPALVLLILFLGIRMLPLMLPIYAPPKMAAYCQQFKSTGLLRWEDHTTHLLPQDYADMLGWKDIGLITARAYQSLDSLTRTQTIIFGDNYGQCGAVEYYGRPYGLPEVQGKQASFLLWLPSSEQFHNLLLVSDDSTDADNPVLTRNFKKIVLLGKITDPYSRQQGDIILMCYGANAYINQWLNARNHQEQLIY